MTSMRSSGLQLQDTLVPERVDAQCEDDDSAVVLYRQTMNTENCLQRTTMMMQAMTIE